MRKKIIVFVGFILMTVAFSMFQCKKYNPPIYDLNSIDATLKRITGKELCQGDIHCHLTLENIYSQEDTVSIAFDSLAMVVSTNYLYSYSFNRSMPGIQSAYAKSPPPDVCEKITDIIIISNKNYSTKYPAGSNLKGIISVRDNNNDIFSGNTTIDEMIENLSLWNYSEYWRDSHSLYTFNIPPETEEIHEITIIYQTEKNQIHTAVLKNIMILK